MKKLLLLLITPFLSFGQQLITENMIFDGQEREYIVYLPSGYDATSEFPVLFSFHGGAGYAEDFIYTRKQNEDFKIAPRNIEKCCFTFI